jgi:hypothetical protein
VALLSEPHAALEVSLDGTPVETAGGDAGEGEDEGEVRSVELASRGPRQKMRVDLSASAGGVVALWAIPLDSRPPSNPRRD